MTAKRVKRARNLAKREIFLEEVKQQGLRALQADQHQRKAKQDAEVQAFEKSISDVLELRHQFYAAEFDTPELRKLAKKELNKLEADIAHELKRREMSSKDIADKLKCSENTIRLYLKRGF